jgi:hypothetical protein
MKKLLILFFVVVGYSAQAQMFIPRAGISLAKIDGDDNTGIKQRLGFAFGVAYVKPLKGAFSFQPELLFVQKGAKLDYSESEPGIYRIDLSGKLVINYLEVPLLINADLPTNSPNFKVFLIAGPAFAIGLGGTTEVNFYYEEDGSVIIDEELSGKVKFGDPPANDSSGDAYVNRFELSLQLGGGIIIKDKFLIDLRYGIGLTDLADDDTSRHRVFQATIGIPIKLVK